MLQVTARFRVQGREATQRLLLHVTWFNNGPNFGGDCASWHRNKEYSVVLSDSPNLMMSTLLTSEYFRLLWLPSLFPTMISLKLIPACRSYFCLPIFRYYFMMTSEFLEPTISYLITLGWMSNKTPFFCRRYWPRIFVAFLSLRL